MNKASLYIIASMLTFAAPMLVATPLEPTSSDSLRNELPIEQEALIGNMLLAYLRSENLIFPDSQVQEYIQSIGAKLAVNANVKYFMPHFVIVDSPVINAFAFFGANVAIHSGLILLTEDESELAAVMAHELAHVSQGHLLRLISYQRKSLPLTIAGSLAAVLVGMPQLIIPVLSAGHQHAVNFTRDHEKEADRIGMQILAKSHYSPFGMPNMFVKMGNNSRYEAKYLEYLLTHPLYENRIAETTSIAESYKYRQTPNSLNYELTKLRLQILGSTNLHALLKKYQELYQQDPNNVLLTYAYTYCLVKSEKIKQASKISWPASDNLMVKLLQVEIKGASDLNQAIEHLKNLHARHPESMATLFMLCDYLLQTKNIGAAKQAQEYLLKFIAQTPNEPEAFEMLRLSAGMLKQQSFVHYCNANLFALYGNLPEALKELDKSLMLLPKSSSEYRATLKLKKATLELLALQKSI